MIHLSNGNECSYKAVPIQLSSNHPDLQGQHIGGYNHVIKVMTLSAMPTDYPINGTIKGEEVNDIMHNTDYGLPSIFQRRNFEHIL